MELILTTFVGRRQELEQRERLAQRVGTAAPLLSKVRRNTNLFVAATAPVASQQLVQAQGLMSSGGGAASVISTGDWEAVGRPSATRATPGHTSAALLQQASASVGACGQQELRMKHLASGGPMSLPRSMTLTAPYSAIAPTLSEFTLARSSATLSGAPSRGSTGAVTGTMSTPGTTAAAGARTLQHTVSAAPSHGVNTHTPLGGDPSPSTATSRRSVPGMISAAAPAPVGSRPAPAAVPDCWAHESKPAAPGVDEREVRCDVMSLIQ